MFFQNSSHYAYPILIMLLWLKQSYINHSPHHHKYLCYGYQSQSWVVYDIVLTTLIPIFDGENPWFPVDFPSNKSNEYPLDHMPLVISHWVYDHILLIIYYLIIISIDHIPFYSGRSWIIPITLLLYILG